MRKIFLVATFILTLLTATVSAAEKDFYEYTSQTYGFKIICPNKPIVILNPFEDPKQRGELLVFEHDDTDVVFGYQIKLDAFDDKQVPDFNNGKKKAIDAYIEKLRGDNAYEFVGVETVSKNSFGVENKGVVLITAKEIEVKDDNGEVTGVLVADQQTAFTFFRTRSGRCLSIQLIAKDLTEEQLVLYRSSVATYRDATDLSMPPETADDGKSKKKKKK